MRYAAPYTGSSDERQRRDCACRCAPGAGRRLPLGRAWAGRAPTLQRTCHETIKLGADNPDNYYLNAPISGKYEYRIRGRRGAAVRAVGGGVYRPRERIAGYRDLLKMLDWQRPGERWLLKSPAHLWALDVLGELFPDAMRRHVEANPQNRHGTHEYSLEEFGLTPGRSSALSACP